VTARSSLLLDSLRVQLDNVGQIDHDATDQAVHAARQGIKKARATLRLMRAGMGGRAYRAANEGLRDAARVLTPVRDTTMLLSTVKAFIKPRDAKDFKSYAAQLRLRLQDVQQMNRARLVGQDFRRQVDALRGMYGKMSGRPSRPSDAQSARRGIGKSYRTGRKAFASVRKRPTNNLLHEWRKQAKYLANELELARQLFQVRGQKIHRRASRLASVLGADHDLALLRQTLRELRAGRAPSGNSSHRKQLERRIVKRRRDLQSTAQKLGRKLYGGAGARKFAARIKKHLA
jgi:CHAD domain-containing protein